MGNRSYLYIEKQEKDTFFAFESKNSLPFFWITLISENHITSKIDKWKYLETCSEEEANFFFENENLNVEIKYEDFKRNSLIGVDFFTVCFPEVLPLYKDFIRALESVFSTGDVLQIELIEYTWFYESIDEFAEQICDTIRLLKQKNKLVLDGLDSYDLIATGTGFPSISLEGFEELPSFIKASVDRQNRPKLKRTIHLFNKSILVTGIVVFILAVLFTITLYKDFLFLHDLDYFLVSVLVFSFLGYCFSVTMIVSEIKNYYNDLKLKLKPKRKNKRILKRNRSKLFLGLLLVLGSLVYGVKLYEQVQYELILSYSLMKVVLTLLSFYIGIKLLMSQLKVFTSHQN